MTKPFIVDRLNRMKPSSSSMAGQKARKLGTLGRDIIGLTPGESDFDTPRNVTGAIVRAMSQFRTKCSDAGRVPVLKTAIQAKFHRDNRLKYATNEIIVGIGAKQVIVNAQVWMMEAGSSIQPRIGVLFRTSPC